MKLKFYLYLGIAAFAFASCSDDDANSENENTNNPENAVWLVKNETHTNGGNIGNYTWDFSYDDQGRSDQFIYTDLFIHSESEETHEGSGRPIYFTDVYLDSSKKIAQSVTKSGFYGYKSTYTYDQQGRIVDVQVEEQFYNDQGYAQTNYELHEQYTLTWDNSNNLTSIKRIWFGGNGEPETYYLQTFSGFEQTPQNSLKTKNYGFDFYGNFAYQSEIEKRDPFGHGLGGEKLPSKTIEGTYDIQTNQPVGIVMEYNFSYVTDNLGRVVERKLDYIYEGENRVNNYFYSYY